MVKNKRLSTWLRSGVIDENVKDTLKSTLNELHKICPLNTSRSSLRDSLRDILYSDKNFCQKSPAHAKILGWFEGSSKQTKQTKRAPLRFNINNYNNNNDTKYTRETSPPPVKQEFSFTSSEQGGIIEPLLNIVEKAFYKFLVDNERYIPSMLWNPSVLNNDLLNFKKNVRNKVAHGIVVDEKGRWSDHDLQHVSILACDVVLCLGGDRKEVSSNKENIDNEIVQRWINKADKDHSHSPQKRKLDDTSFGKIIEFILDILEKTEEIEEGDKRKILRLALDEDEYLIKLWRAIKIEEKQVQIQIEIEKRKLRYYKYINSRLGGTGNKFSRKSRPSRRGCGVLVVEQFICSTGRLIDIG
ncbi:hypothetical protein C1645_821886 [Glomus cerebriforme]|uniref:Uncharacterized protein n=1 Tax=Glomus cerebriforme TaxID=658196 RepID=A0A397T935_9GLOM|nr:hypothetical protein C1645_821886 [Glomus cerebriforme]